MKEILMIACIDVGYDEDAAVAACVCIQGWRDHEPLTEFKVCIPTIQDYEPGKFYLRELPCVMAVLEQLATPPSCIVIDGYVWLDANNLPGLGARLHDRLNGSVPVIGVAKSTFRGSEHAATLCRGKSKRPLFITSVGIAKAQAVINIGAMHGANRIPTMLARADRLSRSR
jgi:deoxyribonuclease V